MLGLGNAINAISVGREMDENKAVEDVFVGRWSDISETLLSPSRTKGRCSFEGTFCALDCLIGRDPAFGVKKVNNCSKIFTQSRLDAANNIIIICSNCFVFQNTKYF